MAWNLEEALSYYQKLGAPKDQSALINLLREIQAEHSGSIPVFLLPQIAAAYDIKESLLQALIKRIPSLRLGGRHCLQLCAGPNCGKHTDLAAYAEKLHSLSGNQFDFGYLPCQRMCSKGPNIRWDGKLYHKADAALLEKLLKDANVVFHTKP